MALKRHPKIPIFNTHALQKIGHLIGRRAKALKHSTMGFECGCVFRDGFERLNLDLTLASSATIRVSAWNDGQLWVGVNIPAKIGWAYEFQGRGRLHEDTSESFMESVETSTLHIETVAYKELTEKLLKDWSKFELWKVRIRHLTNGCSSPVRV